MRKHGEPDIESRGCRTGGDKTTDTIEQISGLLHEAGETHHRVFRMVDGADDDWASCADRVELKQPGKGGTQTAVNPPRPPGYRCDAFAQRVREDCISG
jgi:hypothetical protein